MMAAGTSFRGRDFWDGAINMTPSAQVMHSVPNITSPYSACPLDLTVFVSCCNEESTIVPTLETIVEAMGVVGNSYEILVIDDASQDRSVELVREFMAQHEQVNIVMRINKRRKGLAQNYADGAFMGCGTYYRLVSGDNSEPVETMVDVFKSIGDADIIIPYYVSSLKMTRFHTSSARMLNAFANLVSGNRISCYTTQHMHLRYNVMRWHSDVLGSAFQMDLLCQLLALDFTCKQVPCRAVPPPGKDHGVTVKNVLSFTHAFVNILCRRFARLAYTRK